MTQKIQPTRYCLGCSYVLDGLPENRCPECGRPFDPGNPSTFRKTPRKAPSLLWAALLCLGPFVLIGMLIVIELGYASSPGYPATSPTLPRFLRWTLRAELLVLLLALASVPFIHLHLSTFSGYTRLKPLPKVATALAIGCVYLAAVAGALIFVAIMHMW